MPNTRVPAAGEAMPAAEKSENPFLKVRRLAKELSAALAETEGDYAFATVLAETVDREHHFYFSGMKGEDRLEYWARCFAQTAKEIDPSATEFWMGRGAGDNPQRFMLVVAAKQGEGQ